jgi:hypothetical protein
MAARFGSGGRSGPGPGRLAGGLRRRLRHHHRGAAPKRPAPGLRGGLRGVQRARPLAGPAAARTAGPGGLRAGAHAELRYAEIRDARYTQRSSTGVPTPWLPPDGSARTPPRRSGPRPAGASPPAGSSARSPTPAWSPGCPTNVTGYRARLPLVIGCSTSWSHSDTSSTRTQGPGHDAARMRPYQRPVLDRAGHGGCLWQCGCPCGLGCSLGA